MKPTRTIFRVLYLYASIFPAVVLSGDFIPAASQTPDSGLEAVYEAGEHPYVQKQLAEYIGAEDQLTDYMNKKEWSTAWDPEKKRIFVIYSESFNIEDPSYDDDFITKRSLYATMASMGAKAKIVEYMRTTMSAHDKLTAPGTDVYAALNKDFEKNTRKLNKQKKNMASLMRELDIAEADKLDGITWEDRGKSLMDSVIKKLDASFESGTIEKKKLEKYKKTKKRYEEAMVEIERIEAEAEKLKGTVKSETHSSVDTLAKAPLLGATVVAQAESWDEDEELYEVAVLMVWSEKLEESARAIVTGESLPITPKNNGLSIRDWVQKQDLSIMVGSRQFLDKTGNRWFVGAFGMPLNGSASSRRSSKGIADRFAFKEAVIAVFADVETHKRANIASQTRQSASPGKDNMSVASSFAEETRQDIKDRHVSGNSKILSRTVTHPISGQKMYVVVYAISAENARQAMAMEAENYKNGIAVNKANTYQKGVKAGLETMRNDSLDDADSFSQGINNGIQSVNERVVSAVKPNSAKIVSTRPHGRGKTSSQSVFAGPVIDDDDF